MTLFLLDFSASSLLKQHFTAQQEKRVKQLEYLQDLKESGEYSDCFIREYPIPNLDDSKYILELIESCPYCVFHLSEEYYSNLEFVKMCLQVGAWNIDKEIPKEIQNDKQLILKALTKNIEIFELLNENVKSQITLEEVLQMPFVDDYFIFRHFSELEIKQLDRALLIDAINKELITNHFDFKDRELALLFIKQNRDNIRIVKPDFEWDKDEEAFNALVFPKKAYYKSGRQRKHVTILECVKTELADDRDFVLRIIEHDPESFKYCSDRLKADSEIALKAVSKDAFQINHIKGDLSDDREIILTATSRYAQFFGKASKKLKSDREFIIDVLKSPQRTIAAQFMDKTFYNDPEIRDLLIRAGYIDNFDVSDFTRDQIIDCVSANASHLSKFEKYFTDEEVLLSCVKNQRDALKEIPLPYRTFNICMAAIQFDSFQIVECVECPFFYEVLLAYSKESPTCSYYLPTHYNFKSIEQFKEIMTYDKEGELYSFIPDDLKNDREIALHYVKINGKIYEKLSPELLADPIIIKEAVKHGLRRGPFTPLK